MSRKIKLLVIVYNYPPDFAGGASVFGDMCQGLSDQGFEVTVRAPYPFYPEWKDKSGANGLRVWKYKEGEVNVERYGLYIPRNPQSLLPRLIHEGTFFLSLLRGLPSMRKFDVVMAFCPTVSGVVVATIGRLLFKRRLWLNVQDFAAEAAVAVGMVKFSFFVGLITGFQKWLFNRADIWSTITPLMEKQLKALRTGSQPVLLIPNWINNSLVNELRLYQDNNKTSQTAERPVRFLYSGNIGKKQNLPKMMDILSTCDFPFEFSINGAGAGIKSVDAWLRTHDDNRFELGQLLAEPAFAQQLHNSDYFVISETDEAGASFMPSKLIVALAAGIPILTVSSRKSPLGIEVIKHKLGPHFTWDELQHINQFFLSGDGCSNEQYNQWVDNVKSRFSAYDRNVQINRISKELKMLVSGI